jgi:uncharacterized LabA/DUF88 family protein
MNKGRHLAQHERVNIAVFIDFDNIEIGVRSTLGEHFDIGAILEALKERGEVVTKIAYADWTRAGEYSRALTQHAIRLVQRNLTPGGDKNGADINLALDALEMAFTHPHINAYVIVGGDSDFLSLVEKLKQYDKKVFVVGGRAFTSIILQRNCHEFIAYENLQRRQPARGGRPTAPAASVPITQAFPIVRRALKILSDREVSPQTGLLKSTLLQLDSTFSERTFGASSFLDFTEKLAKAGLVQLKHAGRSVMVELNPDFVDEGEPAAARPDGPLAGATTAPAEDGDGGPPPVAMPAIPEAVPQIGDQAAGVTAVTAILAAATTARWPMYLRNVKQILRAAAFDERRYGFQGLIDLLRACQRDGVVRMERDRRGALRVFQGQPVARTDARPMPGLPADVEAVDASEAIEPGNALPAALAAQPPGEHTLDADAEDAAEVETITVVDTTAELLGRAHSRRPHGRSSGLTLTDTAVSPSAGGRGSRRSGGKKLTGGRRPRARKASGNSSGNS